MNKPLTISKTKNMLPGKHRRQLEDFLKKPENRKRIEAGAVTVAAFAVEAQAALGFAITEPNVRGAAQVMDVKFRRGGRNGSADSKTRARIAALARVVFNLCEEIQFPISATDRADIEALSNARKKET